jgi:enoyl-CoA hydratase
MFSGGLDVKWLPTLDGDGARALVDVFSSSMLRVLASPLPTVALVSGHAVGGGCMLACACDRRIGLRGDYRLHLNEVAVRIPMPSWAALIASRAIPAPRLYDVLQLAEPLGFEEARALGTLHAIAGDGAQLDALGEQTAKALSLLDPSAFATTRKRLWAQAVERARERLGVE